MVSGLLGVQSAALARLGEGLTATLVLSADRERAFTDRFGHHFAGPTYLRGNAPPRNANKRALLHAQRECGGILSDKLLGNHVGQEQILVVAERVERLGKCDKIIGDQLGPLVNQLVEGMLAIDTWLPPVDWPGLVGDLSSIQGNGHRLALRRQLLEVSREALEVLLLR